MIDLRSFLRTSPPITLNNYTYSDQINQVSIQNNHNNYQGVSKWSEVHTKQTKKAVQIQKHFTITSNEKKRKFWFNLKKDIDISRNYHKYKLFDRRKEIFYKKYSFWGITSEYELIQVPSNRPFKKDSH
jgi:hypothetical protein